MHVKENSELVPWKKLVWVRKSDARMRGNLTKNSCKHGRGARDKWVPRLPYGFLEYCLLPLTTGRALGKDAVLTEGGDGAHGALGLPLNA